MTTKRTPPNLPGIGPELLARENPTSTGMNRPSGTP